MSRNRRPQNKHTPFLLIIAGRVTGSYAAMATAVEIGRAIGKWFQVRRGDVLVWEE